MTAAYIPAKKQICRSSIPGRDGFYRFIDIPLVDAGHGHSALVGGDQNQTTTCHENTPHVLMRDQPYYGRSGGNARAEKMNTMPEFWGAQGCYEELL